MKKIIILFCSTIILCSCQNSKNRFLWSKNQVGLLEKQHVVSQLDSVFADDYTIKYAIESGYGESSGIIEIYEKDGVLLLSLTPYTANDPNSKIEYVQIHDARFKTEEGISIKSTFKEIDSTYKISSVDLLVTDAQIRVDDQSFYFTINQRDLPESVSYDGSSVLDKNMIPDTATPEYVFVSW